MHSLGPYFLLITLLAFVQPFVYGRYIAPREDNPTVADETAPENGTTILSRMYSD
jgi:hypothetical protein